MALPIKSNEEIIADIKRGYPLTRYAKVLPQVQDLIVGWQLEGDDMVGISIGSQKQSVHGDCLIFIQEQLKAIFLNYDFKVLVPQNAVTLSFAITGFKCGKFCQEFYPRNGTVPREAFYTYQMLSENVQATYYNDKGHKYLAGVCYYMQLRDDRLTIDIDEKVMSFMTLCPDEFPRRDRWQTWRFVEYGVYGRHCKTTGKRVVIKKSADKGAMHREFNWETWKFELKHCVECAKEATVYRFVPEVDEKKGQETSKKWKVVKMEKGPTPEMMEEYKRSLASKLEQVKIEQEKETHTDNADSEDGSLATDISIVSTPDSEEVKEEVDSEKDSTLDDGISEYVTDDENQKLRDMEEGEKVEVDSEMDESFDLVDDLADSS